MSKTIKINYHQYDIWEDILTSSLALDFVGFEPETLFQNADKKSVYYQCPAWAHKAKRTYIVRCPVDITLKVTPPDDESGEGSIESENLNQIRFDRWISPTFDVENWCRKEKVTLQFNMPKFLFWTEERNVWMEQSPYPLTAVKNNILCLNGWFNLSSWTRSLSFAMDVVDYTKPIVIKRGDPLYQVSFYSKNLDDSYKLVKKEPSEKLLRDIKKRTKAKSYIGRIGHDQEMFKNQKGKCPVEFLWKRDD
jgi:hypothetical protein